MPKSLRKYVFFAALVSNGNGEKVFHLCLWDLKKPKGTEEFRLFFKHAKKTHGLGHTPGNLWDVHTILFQQENAINNCQFGDAVLGSATN